MTIAHPTYYNNTPAASIANRQTFKMMKKQLEQPNKLEEFRRLKQMMIRFDKEWLIEHYPEELIL